MRQRPLPVSSLAVLVASLAPGLLAGCGPGESEPEPLRSAEAAICPAGDTVPGIDVSYYQGNIDWSAVGASKMKFAVARVSYGSGFVDPKFEKNWAGIKAAGLVRGGYQFFVPGEDPVEQAQLLLDQLDGVGGLEPGDLPPMLDVEDTDGVSDAKIISRMHTWLEHVEQGIGRKPLIYTSPGFWNGLGNPGGFSAYPLWVAHWGVDCPTVPSGSWSDFVFWQEGPFKVDGIANKVDGDYFNGGLADLLAFAKETPPLAQVTGNGAISVVSRTDGTADVFVKSSAGDLLHASAVPGGAEPWSELEPLVGNATCGFAASSWPPTQKATEVWAPLEDGSTTQVWWSKTGGTWSKPNDFGGQGMTELSALAWRDGHVDVFALGGDGAIWQKGFVLGDTWSEWKSLGGDFMSGAAGILAEDGHGELFATDAGGAVWHSGSGKDGWSQWAAIDGHAGSAPVPVRWPDGRLEVFARGADDLLVHTTHVGAWLPISTVESKTKLIGRPSAIVNATVASPAPEVFARDASGRVVRLGWDGAAYGSFALHFDQLGASDPFAWVHPDGRAEVFVVSPDGTLVHSVRAVDADWAAWEAVGGIGVDPCSAPLPGPAGGASGTGGTGGTVSGAEPPVPTSGESAAGCGCRILPVAPPSGCWSLVVVGLAMGALRRRRVPVRATLALASSRA